MNPGDIIEDQNLGRGMIVYFDIEHYPVCAFPENPDFVLCDEETLKRIANINELNA